MEQYLENEPDMNIFQLMRNKKSNNIINILEKMKYADVRKFYNKYKKDLSIGVIINLCLVLLKKREVIQIVKTTKLTNILNENNVFDFYVRSYKKLFRPTIKYYIIFLRNNLKTSDKLKKIVEEENYSKQYALLLEPEFYSCAGNLKDIYKQNKKLFQIKIDVTIWKSNTKKDQSGSLLAQMCNITQLKTHIDKLTQFCKKYQKIIKKINENIVVDLNIRSSTR